MDQDTAAPSVDVNEGVKLAVVTHGNDFRLLDTQTLSISRSLQGIARGATSASATFSTRMPNPIKRIIRTTSSILLLLDYYGDAYKK